MTRLYFWSASLQEGKLLFPHWGRCIVGQWIWQGGSAETDSDPLFILCHLIEWKSASDSLILQLEPKDIWEG